MKLIATAVAALLFGASMQSQAASQDLSAAYAKCAGTKDDKQRLACFDQLTASILKDTAKSQAADAANGGYQSMDLLDLKTDIKSIYGKKVSVFGSLQMVGEMAMLKSELMDMTPVMMSLDRLPRDDRKQALKGCIMVICSIQVYGKVKQGPLGPELEADRVVWQ